MSDMLDQPVKILWVRRKKNPEYSSSTALLPPLRSFLDILGPLLVLLVFIRSSIFEILIPGLSSITFLGVYLILIGSFFLLFLRGEKIIFFLPGVFLLLAVAISCLFSPMRGQAVRKGIGWLFLFGLLGPFLSAPAFVTFRSLAWSYCRSFILFAGISSIFWYFLRLPTIGTGGSFTGIMSHCMLTGPVTAMACLLAVLQGVRRKSYWWGLIGLLCIVPALAAGSRSALLSLMAGLLVIIFLIKRLRILIIFLLPMLLFYHIATPRSEINLDDNTVLGEMTSTLRTKGVLNTREELWESRIAEFKAYPFFGMGVGMGQGAGIAEKKGRVNIEPGSSYLAILSMTGAVGGLAFAILFLTLAARFFRNQPEISSIERLELLSILMLLSVHAAAEGWILAVGSLLALIFWLAVGRLYDSCSPHLSQ